MHPWELWISLPDSMFFDSEGYKKSMFIFYLELFVSGLFSIAMLRATYKNFQQALSVKAISQTLNESAQKLSLSANELKEASNDLSSSTKEQYSSVEQIASALDEISQMANRSSDNIDNLLNISEENLKSADNSRENILNLAGALKAIEESERMILNQVEHNGEQLNIILTFINDIKNKTKLIDDIVFQTKLLSFNASVEAARAGEQGKGFAVVAEEVGKLASSSGSTSKEISDMLNDGINKINTLLAENSEKINKLIEQGAGNLATGSAYSQDSIRQLDGMASLSKEVKLKVIDTQNAIKEQGIGLSEIAQSSHKFQSSSEENKNKCEQTSNIAKSLVIYSDNISQVIVDLNKLTGVKSS
jgi:methyl-accepting chemotaxis protein